VTVRGRFITIEGMEGVGKTTNATFVADWLRARALPVLHTREPGGTALGERLRETLLHAAGSSTPVPLAELLMMFAARAQHLQERIRPALADGTWVLCDRFTDASYAYQGAGRGLGDHPVAVLETLVHGELQPDLTLLLDAPVAIGLNRARRRGDADRFESERAEFFERVRTAYLARAQTHSGRIVVIDASRPLPAVQVQLANALAAWLERLHV